MINVHFQPLFAGKQIDSFKIPDATTGVTFIEPLVKFGITLAGVIIVVAERSLNTEATICLQCVTNPLEKIFHQIPSHNVQSVGAENRAGWLSRPGVQTDIQKNGRGKV